MPPDQLGPEHIREYQAHLLHERKLRRTPSSARLRRSGSSSFKTLKRPYPPDHLRIRKPRHRLPTVLSQKRWPADRRRRQPVPPRDPDDAVLPLALRRSELCRLKVEDIDSERMVVHIRQGKGGKDRDVPLSPKLLETLREYWRWMKPQTWLFPGDREHCARRPASRIKSSGTPCRGRPACRYHQTRFTRTRCGTASPLTCSRAAPICATIQILLGHADLETPRIYLHLSRRHLEATLNPLEHLSVSSAGETNRSYRPTTTRMSRPTVEVADILRAQGNRFLEQIPN